MSHTTRRSFCAAALAGAVIPGLNAAPKARYRVLGKTGLRVSEVGFGGEAVSDAAVHQRAIDLGINFFDTARGYESGNAELLLGKGLGARRKDVIVCSRSYAKDAAGYTADLEASLKAIGTDYFDIHYIGAKDSLAAVPDEMVAAQAAAQKAGKIRFRGLSTHRFRTMAPLFQKERFDVIMAAYSFVAGTERDWRKASETPADVEEVLAHCRREGLGVVAIKVMAGGARLNREMGAFFEKRPAAHLSALKWALRNETVQSAVVRMESVEMLEENARAMSETYTDADAKNLQAALPRVAPYICRMCGACDGVCPRGVPASDVVRYVMYADDYRDFRKGYSCFQALPAETRQVRCADCATCAVRCPNGVRVRDRLMRAQELFRTV